MALVDAALIAACFCLLGLNAWQMWFWQKQIQIMIDKFASRNYAEYVQTKAFEKQGVKPEPFQVHVNDAIDDDLRPLQGIGL